jgi:hypothetical protein
MTEKKGWGQTVLGWFVVKEEDGQLVYMPPEKTDDYVPFSDAAAAPAGAAPPPTPPIFKKDPPPAPTSDGAVDFGSVFEAATIDSDEQDRVAKALALMKSLPEGTEPVVKKQIVEASLKAFGVPIEKIIEAGVQEIQALEAYIRHGATETQKQTQDATDRIAKLEEQIRDLRAEMQQRVAQQQNVIKACNDKKLEVQQILEFFGQEAVARVVQDSPKLHDPTQI